MSTPTKQDAVELLNIFDPEMASLLHREEKRQFETIGLIASENVVSPLVSCLEGSVFTNKNTEGYPGKRFVGGCQLADQAELLALERVKRSLVRNTPTSSPAMPLLPTWQSCMGY